MGTAILPGKGPTAGVGREPGKLPERDNDMKWFWQNRTSWGQRLLAVWLIATGILTLSGTTIQYAPQVLAVLAIIAGALLFVQR